MRSKAGWWMLFVLLAAAVVLRLTLAHRGGQYFWGDESPRFHPCLQVVQSLRDGRVGAALDIIAIRPYHTGFFLVGTPVAALYTSIVKQFPSRSTLWIAAFILSFTSVACIALTYMLARRVGVDGAEALIAAFLMTCSASMFYYSRHLLPYDSSLALALFALWLALGARSSLPRSIVIAVLLGVASFTYYGYVTTAVAVAAVHALRGSSLWEIVKRGGLVVLAIVVWPLLLHALSVVRDVQRFLGPFLRVLGGANQGNFAEGWRLPWEYFWHAEHGLLLVWVLGVALLIGLALAGDVPARGWLWLGLAASIWLMLTVNSTVLHRSVVLGRVARQLVPFLCLATACAIRRLVVRTPRAAVPLWIGAVLVVAQAAFNFAPPFAQRFPADVEREVLAAYHGNVGRDVTVHVNQWRRVVDRPSRYILLNTVTFLYPATGIATPQAYGETIMRHPHPLEFTPYQYEAYGPEQRAILRSTDISMRLIDTARVDVTSPGRE